MKLAFSTLGNPSWTFERTVAEAKRLGFDAIEVRGVLDVMRAEEIDAFSPSKQASTQRLLMEAGISLCGLGTSVSFHNRDKRDDAIAEGRAAIDVCARMGIPFIRVFGDKVVAGESDAAAASRVARGILDLCAYARGRRVSVLLEIHGDFNTVERVAAVCDEAGQAPEFGLLWDIAHSDKVYGDDFLPMYAVVKPFLKHVHIKDHRRMEGTFPLCFTGDGDIPIPSIVRRLNADGFEGYFSFEWEKRWHPELPEPELAYPGYVAFMRSLE